MALAAVPTQSGAALPCSVEAEESVVGAALLHPETFIRAAHAVQGEDFHHPALRAIFEALVELDRASKPLDVLTVAEQMTTAGTLDKLRAVGGADFLTELQMRVISVENVEYHAKLIATKAERRRWIQVASQIAARGFSPNEDDETFLAETDRALLAAASAARVQTGGPVAMKAMMNRYAKDLQTRYEQGKDGRKMTGFPTGLERIDSATAGLQRGDLVIIAGRPSMGKSALAGGFAHAAAKSGVHCLFLSLEMPAVSLLGRMIAADAPIDADRLRRGDMESHHWVRASASFGRLATLPIWWDDTAPMTFTQIRSTARRWRLTAAKDKDAMVVIDYLGLVALDRRNKNDTHQNQIAEITRGLKLLAKELNAPVVLLAQLNRELERRPDKRPKLSDLRDSGSLEQDGDLILFVYRDEVYDPDTKDKGIAEIIIGKQRNGPTGVERAAFVAEYAAFQNLEPSRETADHWERS